MDVEPDGATPFITSSIPNFKRIRPSGEGNMMIPTRIEVILHVAPECEKERLGWIIAEESRLNGTWKEAS